MKQLTQHKTQPLSVEEKLSRTGHEPGVYLLKDEKNVIIYIGKALDLRKRLAAYFKNSGHTDMKTGVLVHKIFDFDTIITGNEKEALILESNLIKRHRPRYNVVLKDDKRYPSLRLDLKEKYPAFSIVRKIGEDDALYFGPFASAYAVRETLKTINKTFKLRKCRASDFKTRTRPCLHCQMEGCLAPCCLDVDPKIYRDHVNEATNAGATAGTLYCNEVSGAPADPSQTTVTFSSGVATTASTDGQWKSLETTTLSVTIGTFGGTSSGITVSAGAGCRVALETAAAGAGSEIASGALDLNATLSAFAIGYDRFGNDIGDITVSFTGSGGIFPWAQTPTTYTATLAQAVDLVGVDVSVATISALYTGASTVTGDNTYAFEVTISAGAGASQTWTTATSETDGVNASNLLGNNNVVDVFYWDTSETNDNWRHNSARSWHSEAFAANDRGSKQEFPERVFVVGHASGVDLIDATNNKLFMRFSTGAGFFLDSGEGSVEKVAALNGRLYVVMTNALVIADFVNDTMKKIDQTDRYSSASGISARNASVSWTGSDTYYSATFTSATLSDIAVVRIGTNDHVAVGTATTVEVINDNGTSGNVYNSTGTAAAVTAVDIVSDGTNHNIYYAETGVGLHRHDFTGGTGLGADFAISRTYNYSSAASLPSLTVNDLSVSVDTVETLASNSVFVGTDRGLVAIQENSTAASSTSYAYQAGEGSSTRNDANFGSYFDLTSAGSGCVTLNGWGQSTNDVTVEMFVRPAVTLTSGAPSMTFATFGQTGQNGTAELRYNGTSGALEAVASKGGEKIATSGALTMNPGQWYHVVLVVEDGGRDVDLWLDGVHQGNNNWTGGGFAMTNTLAYIGCGYNGTATFQYFNGAIDEVRVSNSALYPTNTGPITVPSTELTGGNVLLHMNGTSNSTATDSSGNTRDATLIGAALPADDLLVDDVSDDIQALDSVDDGAGGVSVQMCSGTQKYELGSMEDPTTATSVGNTALTCSAVETYQYDSNTDYDTATGLSTGGLRLDRE